MTNSRNSWVPVFNGGKDYIHQRKTLQSTKQVLCYANTIVLSSLKPIRWDVKAYTSWGDYFAC